MHIIAERAALENIDAGPDDFKINAAAGHPKVSQAAVIGICHLKWEERPLMLVVPAKGVALSKQEILDFLSTKFAKWQLPEDILFVDELPLTATGKTRKTALREMYKEFSFSSDGG